MPAGREPGSLRKARPGSPVAVVSAHAPDGAPAGLLGHADHYLEQPLRVDQLIATATVLIGRGRQRWAGPYPDTPGHDTLPT